jgi:PTS system mannose-specific IIA component
LADEFLAAAQRIAGEREHMSALSLEWNDDVETSRERVREAVERLDLEDGLLILTDVFGGTPYNLATNHYQSGTVEILAGVNLPIVVRLACLDNARRPLTELAEWIEQKGRTSVCLGGLPEKTKLSCRPVKVAAGSGDGQG